jgi:hypothetical protein
MRAAAIASAIVLAGCAQSWTATSGRTYTADGVTTYEEVFLRTLRVSAAHDIPCAFGQIAVRKTPFRDTAYLWGSVGPEGVHIAEGCGTRVSYVVENDGRLLLVGTVRLTQ